ncbi:MAG: toll/interleukin-1 receptor domain-containing protein [Anaerolineae bacterium]|nr:toll/interleukin-1 receptor domain-containing protein [Anaerolineae bacterium]
MTSIFISYRRADSMAYTGRIYDRLVNAFGARHVFKDVEDIPPGEDFRSVLDKALTVADVVIIVIGPQWLLITDDGGKRRLNDPNDFVRIEVETALKRTDVLVVPVLVNNASMPSAESLPPALKDLAFRNSVVVRNDPDFNPDINHLITAIEKRLKGGAKSRTPMIIGAVVALLVIAALLLFVVLPGMNAPQPAATATVQVAAVSTTLAPTIEPTKEPTSTIEPTIAATATTVAVEATAEVTEASTAAVVSAGDLTPTVAFPKGRPLELIYNDSSFYVFNLGSTLSFSSLKFEALDTSGSPIAYSYDGSRWASQNPNLTAQGCGALEPVQFLQFLHPDKCKVFNSKRSNLLTSEYFWRTASGGSTFRVLWNDVEVARCPVQAGSNTCDVKIPPA